MDNQVHNAMVSFIWGIADDCLRDVYVRGKYRDVILPMTDQIMNATYSCYDGACGTGGMLTVAQDRLLSSAKERGKNVSIHLFGQELQPETYARQILEIPDMVAKDERYQNAMKNSDEQNARMESERALQQVIFAIMADNMELFKQFQDNPSFKKWLSDLVFNMTYEPKGKKQSAKNIVSYSEHQTPVSMVAEDNVPYGTERNN